MRIKSIVYKLLPKAIKLKLDERKRYIDKEHLFDLGYQNFVETGKTSDESYQLLIELFCLSNGAFDEEYHSKHFKIELPERLPKNSSFLGEFNTQRLQSINETLEQDGYVHFDEKLSTDVCRRLSAFSLNIPATTPYTGAKKVAVNLEFPESEIYRLSGQHLLNNEDVQNLIMDPVLIEVARNYLGCEPIFDYPSMWWSTAHNQEATSEAAQFYHFDMDRIKWLKIFFYLTPVTEKNGPHSYIKGTHRPNMKPKEILKKGYVRIMDDELHPHYDEKDVKIVTGEEGSLFAGDTKCWHKGMHLKEGNRLVLELNYTASMFGANREKFTVSNPRKKVSEFFLNNEKYTSNLILDDNSSG